MPGTAGAAALAGRLSAALGVEVCALAPARGGDLNDAWRAELADGRVAFVKTPRGGDAAPGAYAAEAAGLRWLAEPGAIAVPHVLAHADAFLALAWLDEGRLDAAGEEALGRGLAALHAAGAPAFGATPPGSAPRIHIGALALPSEPAPDAATLLAQSRLRPVARVAHERGALAASALHDLDRLCERLPELLGPPEPPARLHGDLWSGNVIADDAGAPILVDPIAYGGHRETDLAMLRLFGGPSERCFAAYEEAAPLAAGHAERVELHQLFPLLVHAALFGGHYGSRAAGVIARYL
jgi:fructosamine-3-kinase